MTNSIDLVTIDPCLMTQKTNKKMCNKMSSTATMNMITGSDAVKNDFVSFFIEVDQIPSQRISENSYIISDISPRFIKELALSKSAKRARTK